MAVWSIFNHLYLADILEIFFFMYLMYNEIKLKKIVIMRQVNIGERELEVGTKLGRIKNSDGDGM